MATIKDVSQLANVSISTVSRVINNTAQVAPEKREAVVRAMEELHYRPNSFAQALVSKRSDCIGLIVGDLGGGPFFVQMMKGIEEIVDASDRYTIVMSGHHSAEKERHAIDILLQRQCDAVIIHSMALSDDELREVADCDTPFIFINRLIPGLEHRCVYLDNHEGCYKATSFLLEKGHKDIAFITTDDLSFSDGVERLSGYRFAMEETSGPLNEQLIARAYPDEVGGSQAVDKLLERGVEFSAIVGYNDSMVAGALSALRDKGFDIPGQISVVGYDDNHYARFVHPKLTTVRYPIEDMGKRAAQLAVDILDTKGQEIGPNIMDLKFHPELIVRDSAANKS
ncbi:LacI family DNA-binding transcriptional regulator [Agarivorans sp. MS3-6]|uniref:LacI family DNA-binding transcriptional regulator n=1 Tax=Agarivorans sp. TSD2052 TaxID=2937286 RepID=UPI00200EB3D6|nr:LacI family DNA-binding transcriptional regulator [Agarivorans sp. TSD2052]UPW17382.1 LacI family DNA-binding transcriptional regulator [Agarivorans sp. TSD2052]